MVERSIQRPKEIARRAWHRSGKEKAVLAMDALALIAWGAYALSTLTLLGQRQYGEAGASGLDTLRMTAITALVIGVGELIKHTNFTEEFKKMRQ